MAPKAADEHPHFVIVGGGMVGISLALLLGKTAIDQQLPWRITLVESFPIQRSNTPFQPSFDHRSTAVSAGSQQIFAGLGLWPQLSQHVTVIDQVHVSDRGHFGGALLSNHYHLEALGYVVENPWFGRVLSQHLLDNERIEVLAPAKVISAKATAQGYRLELDNRTPVAADLLIIADGADSPLCRQLGIERRVEDYHQEAIIANVGFEKPHRNIAFERFTDAGPLALLPLSDNTAALIWTSPEADSEYLLTLAESQFKRHLQDRFGYRLGKFTAVSERFCHHLQLVVSREQVRRHLVVVGNAAHSLHPVAGQGFNLALRDCEVLANTLTSNPTHPGNLALLEAYECQRASDQNLTINLSDQLVKGFSSDQLLLSSLRNLGLLALNLTPPLQRQLARQTMGLA